MIHTPSTTMALSLVESPLPVLLPHIPVRCLTNKFAASSHGSFCCTKGRRHTQFLGVSLFSLHRKSFELNACSEGKRATVVCAWDDFIGGDLLGFDLGKWVEDVETFGAIAMYVPPEGGYEGRYATRLKALGYHFMNLTARGLGDPEAYLSKVHGVRPAHLGKQPIARFYFPPEVDYRLSLLPKDSKGLVIWLIEAQVLSKTELQYLALLPALQPRVRVIAECGSWRKVRWKPLREVAGLEMPIDVP